MVRSPAVVLALATAIGAGGCLRPRGTPAEPVVVDVRIEGMRELDEEDLLRRLATRESGRWWWQEEWRLDPDALAVDRRRVEAYYRERGYYEARVEDVQVVPAGSGRVRVVMRVDEGRPVRVTSIDIPGLEEAEGVPIRREALPLRNGDVFTEGAYDAARRAIGDALHTNGWALAEVTQRAVVLPDAGTAEVTYEVDPGKRWRFGPIFIAGTSALPRDRIREQVLAAVKPGEWFDERKLRQAQARVFDLGVFGGVRVTRGEPDARRGTIPVVVAVREAPFRTLRAGPGVGVEATRWDAHALFGWQHRNFMGGMRRLGTEVQLGYAWVPSPFRTEKEGTIALLAAELSQPGAFTRYVDARVRVELEKGIEEAYDFYSERLRLSLPLRLGRRWSIVPSYNFEIYHLSNYGTDFDPSAPAESGEPQLEGCELGPGVCLLSYLEQRIAWDGRDEPLNTRKGLYLAVSFQQGFQIGTYGYQYFRVQPEVRAFWPLGRNLVLATRARVGALIPVNESEDPPIVARFSAGGPQSMRGYYTGRLAPMVLQEGDWVSVGGNGLLDGAVELRFGIGRHLAGAVFLDAGNVADNSEVPSEWRTVLDVSELQLATGVGLGYQTPFGPLRLDVGVRLPDSLGHGSDSFPAVPYTFYEDGKPHREPIVAVHLSFGGSF